MEQKFKWPAYPKNAMDFELLMRAIDDVLSRRNLEPFQRPIHVGPLLWDAFEWVGSVFPPDELANQEGFEGDVLMAKCSRWYELLYGEQIRTDFAYGFAPVKLANALWRVRAFVNCGSVFIFADRNLANQGVTQGGPGIQASFNILCAIDDLPQGLASRLTEQELRAHLEFHFFMHQSLQWRDTFPRTELLDMARADYDTSTADVLGRRYGQARWSAQQAIEKTLKGLLKLAGTPFPTGGSKGHDLLHLGKVLEQEHGICIAPAVLSPADCSPKVRYGEEPSIEAQAIGANHAVLGVLEQLRKSPNTAMLFATRP